MLVEQAFRPVVMEPADLKYIVSLGFQVAFDGIPSRDENAELVACQINPGAFVGHFQLPSGRIAAIQPKVDTASVFRMLAYVFTDGHRRLFRDEDVQYTSDALMFEPLVDLFNGLVSARARRGLVQDYIRRDENLGVFRGALNINVHVQQNLGRENRVHCRFFEQTVDVPENCLVKTTLLHLLQFGGWTSRTTQSLIRNLHHFDAVTLERSRPETATNMHYHRLNDDYRPIHQLCRMFLACSTISERVGTFAFKGFLLDMNLLYEQFVQKAFITVLRRGRLRVEIQKQRKLSLNPAAPDIRPDVTVRAGTDTVVVADAKYKKDEGGPRNPDIYQVITYGTVLQCSEVYLLYPQTELDHEIDMEVINSPIVVKSRRIDISSRRAVENTESLVKEIVAGRKVLAPDLKSA